MYILLKLHYAQFDASRLLCSNFIEEKPLGVSSTPLGKGRVKEDRNTGNLTEKSYSQCQKQ